MKRQFLPLGSFFFNIMILGSIENRRGEERASEKGRQGQGIQGERREKILYSSFTLFTLLFFSSSFYILTRSLCWVINEEIRNLLKKQKNVNMCHDRTACWINGPPPPFFLLVVVISARSHAAARPDWPPADDATIHKNNKKVSLHSPCSVYYSYYFNKITRHTL